MWSDISPYLDYPISQIFVEALVSVLAQSERKNKQGQRPTCSLMNPFNPHQTGVSESLIQAIFQYSKQQKPYQGTLRTQELTPIGPETSLGPSMDPTGPLKQMFPDTIIFKIRVNKNPEYVFIHFFKPCQNIMSLLKQNIQIPPPLSTD